MAPTELEEVRAEIRPNPCNEDVNGKLRIAISTPRRLVNIAHVLLAAQAKQSTLRIQDLLDLVGRYPLLIRNERDDARVDVSASGRHDQASRWRQTHRGVNRPPGFHGAHAGTRPEVHQNQVAVFDRLSQALRGLLNDEFIGSPMKSVSPDPILLHYFLWQGVRLVVLWHGRVEGSIKDRDLDRAWKRRGRGIDAQQVRRVVQGCDGGASLYLSLHAIVDDRSRIAIATHDHPVTNRHDIIGVDAEVALEASLHTFQRR